MPLARAEALPARKGVRYDPPMAVTNKPPRFGQIAVAMGFCGKAEVDQALRIQREQDGHGERHRLLGILMVSEGLLSTTQLIEILKTIERQQQLRSVRAKARSHL